MRLLLSLVTVCFLAFATFAAAQCRSCGPSGGSTPTLIEPMRLGAAKYEWKACDNNPDDYHLWRNGVQIGGWRVSTQKYRSLIDWNTGTWGTPKNDAWDHLSNVFVPIPEDVRIGTRITPAGKLEVWKTKGVNESEMCRHERYSISGQNVALKDALSAIGNPTLPDDSAKMHLSVFSSDPSKRSKVIADLKANGEAWKLVSERCHVWAGDAADPNHFLTKDREGKPLYCIEGDPCVSLQANDGTELYRDPNFTGGPGPLVENIRKADPTYNPKLTPGPHAGTGADNLTIPLIAAGVVFGGIWLGTRRKE